MPVRMLADHLSDFWGEGASWREQQDIQAPHEARQLALSVEAAMRDLRWVSKLSVLETLKWTAAWYKNHARDPKTARTTTQAQIRAFMELQSA